ncbi:hypothetical protein E2C01_003019 [Portunus trituberculatus]|uniref:Uncharacterized protein n=1 Tax=Portunus trituberculatus TaxID=210409 RepID=A0A5B7CPW5_PORTR|nr:hypothetical protein [Portunus trituberculatus]
MRLSPWKATARERGTRREEASFTATTTTATAATSSAITHRCESALSIPSVPDKTPHALRLALLDMMN